MSVIPERWCDEPDDEPEDECADERRAARHDTDRPPEGWAPIETADFLPWLKVNSPSRG